MESQHHLLSVTRSPGYLWYLGWGLWVAGFTILGFWGTGEIYSF